MSIVPSFRGWPSRLLSWRVGGLVSSNTSHLQYFHHITITNTMSERAQSLEELESQDWSGELRALQGKLDDVSRAMKTDAEAYQATVTSLRAELERAERTEAEAYKAKVTSLRARFGDMEKTEAETYRVKAAALQQKFEEDLQRAHEAEKTETEAYKAKVADLEQTLEALDGLQSQIDTMRAEISEKFSYKRRRLDPEEATPPEQDVQDDEESSWNGFSDEEGDRQNNANGRDSEAVLRPNGSSLVIGPWLQQTATPEPSTDRSQFEDDFAGLAEQEDEEDTVGITENEEDPVMATENSTGPAQEADTFSMPSQRGRGRPKSKPKVQKVRPLGRWSWMRPAPAGRQ